MTTKRMYTWRPDVPDFRDYVLTAPSRTLKLPAKVDLRAQMSPVEDQGALGSCTGCAIAGALEFLENKFLPKKQFVDISRLFIYYQERLMEGTVNIDAGAMIRDGVKACAKVGACKETLYPYNISRFAATPTQAAYQDAAKRKITQYLRVTSLAALKKSLAEGYPVVFGFAVFESFESDEVARTGVVPMPSPHEYMLGGHAVLAVGYDDATQRIIVRNSWGPFWGQNGYFTMPYAYVTDRNLSDDFWTIRR